MNSIPLALDLLERHIALADKASSDFERAAVFAATSTLVQELEGELGDGGGYASEKLELVRWNICSIVGYDTRHGQSDTTLKADAIGSLQILRAELLKQI